ncbi:cation diffusion facilitator family transporter [Methylocella sp.]|uniref:cation diffusion facilitator family transporter n=1 Tax=Methylocella sp. TaxID=1978226 RepID=UPI003784364A
MTFAPDPRESRAEQRLLRLSIHVTLATGLVGAAMGLCLGSRSVLFDGVYSLVDVAMTGLALIVSKLLATEGSRRFQFGYWHFEPMVAAFNGTILTLSCLYALLDAVSLLLDGGNRIEFGAASAYAGVSALVCLAMAWRVARGARELDSDLLRVDARAFLVGGLVSLALLASFMIGLALEKAGRGDLAPYVDPLVLAAIILAVAPLPVLTVVRGLREVFLVAPRALDARVRATMEAARARHGFLGFTSYVAKIGRARFIDAYFLLPPDYPPATVGAFDAIRDEIARDLGAAETQLWLNVSFTADAKWT